MQNEKLEHALNNAQQLAESRKSDVLIVPNFIGGYDLIPATNAEQPVYLNAIAIVRPDRTVYHNHNGVDIPWNFVIAAVLSLISVITYFLVGAA